MAKDPVKGYSGERVVLVGESHIEYDHNILERKCIIELKPRYVLHEALKDDLPEKAEPAIKSLQNLSLQAIVNQYIRENLGHELENYREEAEKIHQRALEWKGRGLHIIPESLEGGDPGDKEAPEDFQEFVETPVYRLNHRAREDITESLSNKVPELSGAPSCENSYFNLLDIGEAQFSEANSNLSNKPMGDLTSPICNLRVFGHKGETYQTNLAGCDPQPQKGRSEREKAMAKRIKKYSESNDTDRPVMAIIGSKHLENVNKLLRNLETSTFVIDLSEISETSSFKEKLGYGLSIFSSKNQ